MKEKSHQVLPLLFAGATFVSACREITSPEPALESNNLDPNPAIVIKPGECELLKPDIILCNLEAYETNKRSIRALRNNNGYAQSIGAKEIEAGETSELNGMLDGLEVTILPNLDAEATVDEPLLSATPVPTYTPVPPAPTAPNMLPLGEDGLS